MTKDYKQIIKSVLRTKQWFCFGDVLKAVFGNASIDINSKRYLKYYRTWQDMKIDGSLQIGTSGLYRFNQ